MSNQQIEIGATFAGRYEVIRALSQGGMGAVYEAVHLETDRPVALKVMLPQLLPSAELRERFRKEARAVGRIDSDFVVGVLDAGVDPERQMPFIAMELLRGEGLDARIERVGALAHMQVLKHLWQTAMALEAAHALGIVHRDLKPENLFIARRRDGSERIKVLDFGVAKFLSNDTTTTGVIGTLFYMAPEQVRVPAKVSPASDLYALGMLAFTALTGKAYWNEEFDQNGMVGVALAVGLGKLPEPASARAARYGQALPPSVDAWFERATAEAPDQRFADPVTQITELARALGLSLPSERDSRRPPPAPLPEVARTLPMAVALSAPGTPATTPISRGLLLPAAIGVAALVPLLVLLALLVPTPSEGASTALARAGRDVFPDRSIIARCRAQSLPPTEAPFSIDSLPTEDTKGRAPPGRAPAPGEKITLAEEPDPKPAKPASSSLYANPYEEPGIRPTPPPPPAAPAPPKRDWGPGF